MSGTYLEIAARRDEAMRRLDPMVGEAVAALAGWAERAGQRMVLGLRMRQHFKRRDAFRRDVEHWSRASFGPITLVRVEHRGLGAAVLTPTVDRQYTRDSLMLVLDQASRELERDMDAYLSRQAARMGQLH